jgi:hypothetical protein
MASTEGAIGRSVVCDRSGLFRKIIGPGSTTLGDQHPPTRGGVGPHFKDVVATQFGTHHLLSYTIGGLCLAMPKSFRDLTRFLYQSMNIASTNSIKLATQFPRIVD